MENIKDNENVEKIQPLEDPNNCFAEQDKKFEELQKNLQALKEENKRQMDIIINNLDQLLADRCVIEKTLEEAEQLGQSINIPELNKKTLSVAEVISKLTDFSEDDLKILKSVTADEIKLHLSANDKTIKNVNKIASDETDDIINTMNKALNVNKAKTEEVDKNVTMSKSKSPDQIECETNAKSELSKEEDKQVVVDDSNSPIEDLCIISEDSQKLDELTTSKK